MRSARSASSTPGVCRHDRYRLDRRRADLGAPPGGRGAAALFPRSRYGRGGVSGRLPARAEDLAAERPAARSGRLADHGRAQRRASTRCGARASRKPLPEEEAISDLGDAEEALAERLDGSHYRDDILRLLFICCHPDLPATQQIALALRIVSGLTVKQIARAFLVSEAAMEQRITRAKARVAEADVPFETPGAVERSERLASVAAMIYLVFNEGYSASGDSAEIRAPLCEEAIRLARLLLRLFQTEPEIMGLTALLLLQHARAAGALRRGRRGRAARGPGPRRCGTSRMIAEGLALIDKAMRHRRRGPYQVQAAIAALHARAATPEDTDWAQIDLLYGALEGMQPSPVVTLNRAVAVSKGARAAGGAGDDRAAGDAAVGLFPFLRRARRVADAARPQRGGARSPSTGRSRWPTRRRRPRISACISTA